jgi:hypothetical protein
MWRRLRKLFRLLWSISAGLFKRNSRAAGRPCLTGHLRQIIQYADSGRGGGRVVGPFVAEALRRHGPRDVHFACVWVVNWLSANRGLGYAGPDELDPKAPFTRALREMISRSGELSGIFVTTPDSLDYRPGLAPELRREVERVVPKDWMHDVDV